jgi:hypothetical protein
VAFDPSATFGMRGGYWFDSVSGVGVAGDVSFFEAEANHVRFRIVPVSLLVMLRVPLLVTDEIPGGRLQPYIGIGPSFLYRDSTGDFRPENPKKVAVRSVEAGFDAHLGLLWQFHRHFGVFAEYRFTHLPMDGSHKQSTQLNATLETHHLLTGVSFRF